MSTEDKKAAGGKPTSKSSCFQQQRNLTCVWRSSDPQNLLAHSGPEINRNHSSDFRHLEDWLLGPSRIPNYKVCKGHTQQVDRSSAPQPSFFSELPWNLASAKCPSEKHSVVLGGGMQMYYEVGTTFAALNCHRSYQAWPSAQGSNYPVTLTFLNFLLGIWSFWRHCLGHSWTHANTWRHDSWSHWNQIAIGGKGTFLTSMVVPSYEAASLIFFDDPDHSWSIFDHLHTICTHCGARWECPHYGEPPRPQTWWPRLTKIYSESCLKQWDTARILCSYAEIEHL